MLDDLLEEDQQLWVHRTCGERQVIEKEDGYYRCLTCQIDIHRMAFDMFISTEEDIC